MGTVMFPNLYSYILWELNHPDDSHTLYSSILLILSKAVYSFIVSLFVTKLLFLVCELNLTNAPPFSKYWWNGVAQRLLLVLSWFLTHRRQMTHLPTPNCHPTRFSAQWRWNVLYMYRWSHTQHLADHSTSGKTQHHIGKMYKFWKKCTKSLQTSWAG